jgi:hypothetical protein
MAHPIAFQLRDARVEKGVQLEDLRRLARLRCSADSLCRKLAGKQILTTSEAESIAQALEREIIWTPNPPRRARRRAA